MPTARPRDAPIAIVGRKIPAGTLCSISVYSSRYHSFPQLTIMPKVHAVSPIFMAAVSIRRKIFSTRAFGLDFNNNQTVTTQATNTLTCTTHDSRPSLRHSLERGSTQAQRIVLWEDLRDCIDDQSLKITSKTQSVVVVTSQPTSKQTQMGHLPSSLCIL